MQSTTNRIITVPNLLTLSRLLMVPLFVWAYFKRPGPLPAVILALSAITDLEIKSFMKKFKDKRFAAKCDRALVLKGCDMLGMDIQAVADICIQGMKEHAEELGLQGTAQ